MPRKSGTLPLTASKRIPRLVLLPAQFHEQRYSKENAVIIKSAKIEEIYNLSRLQEHII